MSTMQSRAFKLASLALVLICCLSGCSCTLVVVPIGPTLINAVVGSNVTFNVLITGASKPLISWNMGTLTLATWTLGSGTSPDIAAEYMGVLSMDQNGSLFFWNVVLSYSGVYTVVVTKPGAHEASTNFTLLVYETIANGSVDTNVQDAIEGGPEFTLSYSTMQGRVTSSAWFFNGVGLASSPRYSIMGKSLTITRPSRNDTGVYTVKLTNPFSSMTLQKNITVLYGPDNPVLEVSPTKAAFVSGESLSLTCRAEGEPAPSASWMFKGQTLPTSSTGTLKLTDVQLSQNGTYTCLLMNPKTDAQLERNITIDIRGLSGSAIAGIAAGIPCGILLLLLFAGLIVLCFFYSKKKDRNPRYPVSKSTEKGAISQPDVKLPPDYNFHRYQAISERAGQLPLDIAPVRMATMV